MTYRPGPIMRWLFRAPTHLYRWHLGWLLDRRFVMIRHVGRRSGRLYRTVVEVLGFDPSTREVLVMVGLGRRADWYRNLREHEAVDVTIGRDRFRPVHRELDEEEAARAVARYEERHRFATPILKIVISRIVGWRYTGSPQDHRRLVRELPVLSFAPAS